MPFNSNKLNRGYKKVPLRARYTDAVPERATYFIGKRRACHNRASPGETTKNKKRYTAPLYNTQTRKKKRTLRLDIRKRGIVSGSTATRLALKPSSNDRACNARS